MSVVIEIGAGLVSAGEGYLVQYNNVPARLHLIAQPAHEMEIKMRWIQVVLVVAGIFLLAAGVIAFFYGAGAPAAVSLVIGGIVFVIAGIGLSQKKNGKTGGSVQ